MTSDSWNRVAMALKWYHVGGYEFVDLPWDVSPETSASTKPTGCKDFYLEKNTVLVASGEQSFIEIANTLDPFKRYVGITPCFRDEPTIDATHQRYFMKVELFSLDTIQFPRIVNDAHSFFQRILQDTVDMVELGENLIDLEYNTIELGSYGIRTLPNGLRYVYGTGIAEPRFQTVKDLFFNENYKPF